MRMKVKNKKKKMRMGTMMMAAFMSLTLIGSENAMAATVYSSTTGGKNALLVSGTTKTYSGITVKKTGNSNSGDADFYGTNAAVLAKNKAKLTLKNSYVKSSATHANGVFAYGSGTTVNVKKTKIYTTGNMSGGIMTTGGATMNAVNMTVRTTGNSSAPIRSDRGGGTVNVTGGTFKSTGVGSPAIYSTADINVSKAKLRTTKSEAVVIEGGNSVYLNKCTVVGCNKKKNGQSKYYNNVLIYQSMSGDASAGTSSFTMKGGKMTAKKGAMFHVTNTTCKIKLINAKLNLAGNYLLSASSDNWGTSGKNGGKVTLITSKQKLKGRINIAKKSSLTLKLTNKSTYRGKINSSGTKGTVKVSVAKGCKWTLTGNTYITSLSNKGTINTNGYKLYVNGKVYSN